MKAWRSRRVPMSSVRMQRAARAARAPGRTASSIEARRASRAAKRRSEAGRVGERLQCAVWPFLPLSSLIRVEQACTHVMTLCCRHCAAIELVEKRL